MNNEKDVIKSDEKDDVDIIKIGDYLFWIN